MGKTKKYEALTDELLQYIQDNKLEKGAKLPKVREIISNTGYSYATVNRTLLEMEKLKFISKTQGKGIFVGDLDEDTNSHQVAFIIPKDISKGKIFLDILNGLRRKFEKEKIHLLVSISNMSHEKEIATIKRLNNQNVDGLVLFLEDNYRADYSHISELKERKIPFVLVDRFIPELDTDYVVVNNIDTMFRICSYLKYKESCESIIFISHPDTATAHDEKIEGFRNAIRILYGGEAGKIYSIEELLENYEDFSNKGKNIGLCFFDDLIIAELKSTLSEQGKILAPNFKVFGYNNCYQPRDFPSVEQFNDKVGEKAADLLIKRIKNPDIKSTHFKIEPKIVFPDGAGGMTYEN
jgi:LacI family transcriptional regulator